MNGNLNTLEFNEGEFNAFAVADVTYQLYLRIGAVFILVNSGDGNVIPPSVLVPGSEYKFVLINLSGSTEILFSTPPSINYDGMGG